MNWGEIVKKFPEVNFLQSPDYAKMNEILGATTITEDFDGKGYALMIVRDAKRGRYLEIPCGPLADWGSSKNLEAIFAKIREIAKQKGCVFVRIRPELPDTKENRALLASLGLRKAPMHLAAEHTVILDLTKPLDALLSNMRRQTRYEVKKSLKQGITVEESRSEAIFREFHDIQVETARRQHFVPPSLETLLAEREAFGKNIEIYVAKTPRNPSNSPQDATGPGTALTPPPGSPIAYGLIIRAGHEADYYEAASTPLGRKLPGAYALLWQAIQDLKEEGIERFNLWGIAPPGETNHRYAGVTTFKTGFGGEVVAYVPAHDLIVNPLGYAKDWIVETVRRKRRHL